MRDVLQYITLRSTATLKDDCRLVYDVQSLRPACVRPTSVVGHDVTQHSYVIYSHWQQSSSSCQPIVYRHVIVDSDVIVSNEPAVSRVSFSYVDRNKVGYGSKLRCQSAKLGVFRHEWRSRAGAEVDNERTTVMFVIEQATRYAI